MITSANGSQLSPGERVGADLMTTFQTAVQLRATQAALLSPENPTADLLAVLNDGSYTPETFSSLPVEQRALIGGRLASTLFTYQANTAKADEAATAAEEAENRLRDMLEKYAGRAVTVHALDPKTQPIDRRWESSPPIILRRLHPRTATGTITDRWGFNLANRTLELRWPVHAHWIRPNYGRLVVTMTDEHNRPNVGLQLKLRRRERQALTNSRTF